MIQHKYSIHGRPLNYRAPHKPVGLIKYKSTEQIIQTNFDLISEDTDIFDQGDQGSCTMNALCKLYDFAKKQQGVNIVSSRDFGYWVERLFNGDVGQDAGSDNVTGARVFQQTGVCLENTWGYDDADLFKQPSRQAFHEALNYRTKGSTMLEQDTATIQQVLMQKKLVAFGIQLYESFQEVTGDGIVSRPQPNEDYLGGHDLAIVGWRFINGMLYYVIDNSWGTSWGDNGRCYFPADYLMDPNMASEFITFEI